MTEHLAVVGAVLVLAFVGAAVFLYGHGLDFHPSRLHAVEAELFLRGVGAPDAGILIVVDGLDGVAQEEVLVDEVAVGQVLDALHLPRGGERGAPGEVLGDYVAAVDGQFETLVAGLGQVFPRVQRRAPSGGAVGDGHVALEEQSAGDGGVVVDATVDAAAEECEVETEIPVVRLLPSQRRTLVES